MNVRRWMIAAIVSTAPLLQAAEAPPCPDDGQALEVIIAGQDKVRLLRIHLKVEGQPVSKLWDGTFDRLVTLHDRDEDGVINQNELSRLPSPLALRQVLWGQFLPSMSSCCPWEGKTGKYSREGVFGLYRQAGLGNALVGVGLPPSTEVLTNALLKHLDSNGDQRVEEAEWKAAPERLQKLDRNDDELIGAGELTANIVYPGASGTALLTPPMPNESAVPWTDRLPLWILPALESDTHWANVILKRRDSNDDGRLNAREAGLPATRFATLDLDHDGALTSEELSGWRKGEPDFEWSFNLNERTDGRTASNAATPKVLEINQLRFELRAGEGRLPGLAKSACDYLAARFQEADVDRDGVVGESDFAKTNRKGFFQPLVEAADRNGDGQLSQAEFKAWLDLQESLAKAHVLMTVLDHGSGLFELLDTNRDGALSLRELRNTWSRVHSGGCWIDGHFDRAALPRQLIATVSLGHPLPALAIARASDAPRWFQAMDRNGDGDLSRREFVGPEAAFLKLDADNDGLIDPAEARQNISAH